VNIRQSDLASFARCARQVKLEALDIAEGRRPDNLSATAFGTVIHFAAQLMEELHHAGRDDALQAAVATFEHHWNPENIGKLVPGGIDQWLPRQTQGGLLIRGRENLRTYYQALQHDAGRLLALELAFHVPIQLDGPDGPEDHVLDGTVDRLALRLTGRKPYLSVDDFKSGAKPTYLRHALQWTIYGWASTRPEFWVSWDPDQLELLKDPLRKRGFALYFDGSGLPVIPRRGRWIALRDSFGIHDCGWRTPADYARMRVALQQYIAAVRADIYPLAISGQTCTYCPFLYSGKCSGVPHDKNDEGEPYTTGV